MLKLEQYRYDRRNLAPQVRLRNQHLRLAVQHPVLDRVRPERREKRPRNGPNLEYAEEREVQLRQPFHVDEYAVALLDAQARQHIGELVRLLLHLPERVSFLLAVLPLPDHRNLIAVAPIRVAVDSLVRLVQATARQPVQFVVHLLPVEVPAHLVIVKVRLRLHVLNGRLAYDRK